MAIPEAGRIGASSLRDAMKHHDVLAAGILSGLAAGIPMMNPGFRGAFQAIGGSWVLAHAVFGVTLGIAPSLRRWVSREASGAISDREPVHAQGIKIASTTRTT